MSKAKSPRLTKKLIEKARSILSNPKAEILKGTWIGDCSLCGKEDSVGEVHRQYGVQSLGYPTCFGDRICTDCEEEIRRQEIKTAKSDLEKTKDRDYKRFLKGELYPEVVCEHRPENGLVAKARLKSAQLYKATT